jgi:MoaA/NifB/PqqE/SkfB family radical SAM enzyme
MKYYLKRGALYTNRHIIQQIDYFLEKGWSKPDKVSIYPTRRCNAKCLMCSHWESKGSEVYEIPSPQWIGIIEELHDWIGPFFLSIMGGEILIKKGIYDIIRRAVELDISLNVQTNGIILRSEKQLEELFDTGLRSIHFSIDGIDQKVHDKFRGINGVHKTVTQVIKRIKKLKPQMFVSMICIIMRETIEQLVDYVYWAEQMGIDQVLFQPIGPNPGIQNTDSQWYEKNIFFIQDNELVNKVMNQLITLKQKKGIISNSVDNLQKIKKYFQNPNTVQIRHSKCMKGQANLLIDDRGNISFCSKFNTVIGNVNDSSIKEAWKSPLANRFRREIKQCNLPCMTLDYRTYSLSDKIALFFKYSRLGKL